MSRSKKSIIWVLLIFAISSLLMSCTKDREISLVVNEEDGSINNQNIQDNQDTTVESEVVIDGIVIGDDIRLTPQTPIKHNFTNVSVHDPSVIYTNGTYYVFGSHLAVAKSDDLMNWSMVGSGVSNNNPVIPNVREEMKEAFEWARTDTFWAPDVIQLLDGNFYMYYCTCEGSMPLGSLGVAVAESIEGPYKDLGIILKSGMPTGVPSENGDSYNANIHPNAVDPCLYFDKEGRLWMMYGSYSGGIFVLEMDPYTGFPLESGLGKKIMGGNHARIEGPYVIFNPDTEYYYLFVSYGGLAADGGYNIRVARSKTPNGPYYDTNDVDMIMSKGAPGTFFRDASIYSYGVKLMGNYRFNWVDGESTKIRSGYVSPGHNSAYYDEKTGKYFLILHTRFEFKGEGHEVRVHQMYFNEDGWPVVSPFRYVGEDIGSYEKKDVVGTYKYINHGNDISNKVVVSKLIELKEDNSISGAITGKWELNKDGRNIELTIGENTYRGVVTINYDEQGKKEVMTFTAISKKGIAIWGSGLSAVE